MTHPWSKSKSPTIKDVYTIKLPDGTTDRFVGISSYTVNGLLFIIDEIDNRRVRVMMYAEGQWASIKTEVKIK